MANSSPSASVPVCVVCMKWGTLYGPEYVNKLYGMVARHLSRSFRFVCFTDDDTGIREEVECQDMPFVQLEPPYDNRPWRKLGLQRSSLPGVEPGETALFLDLDVVIVGSLDPFFEYPGDFCIIHNWTHPDRIVGNTSVFRFVVGKQVDVVHRFDTAPVEFWAGKYDKEQSFLSHSLGPERMTYWPAEWCISFKRHCLPRWPRNFWSEAEAPTDARIIVFHGHPNPHEALAGEWPAPLYKRLYKHVRPVQWIGDHWRE